MKKIIAILLLFLFLTQTANAMGKKIYTKDETWKKSGGKGKAPKGLSRRELWSAATGESKLKAPSWASRDFKVKKAEAKATQKLQNRYKKYRETEELMSEWGRRRGNNPTM